MSKYSIQTNSEAQTLKVAKGLANLLGASSVLTLEGTLGVGKTTFTKGLAKGLGVQDVITSPTFTIIKEYMGKNLPLYHIDAYRLEHSEEDIGFDEYFYGNGVTVIEWAQFIEDYLPESYLEITIDYIDEHTRLLNFKSIGKKYESIVGQINEGFTK